MCNKHISIIIPYYRAKKFFLETLQSIYKQTGIDKEVIVVNDGSGEEDEKFLLEIQMQYGFKLLHQSNKGVSAARNAGLKSASGTHILFLDADDTLDNNTLITLSASNADVVLGSYSSGGNMVAPNITAAQFVQGNPIQIGTALMKTDVVKSIHGFNEELAYGEDMDFWFRIWLTGVHIAVVDRVVLHYRDHASNSMKKNSVKKLTDNLLAFRFRASTSLKKQLLTEHEFKKIFVSRVTTHHWYARELGWRYILKHYSFLIGIKPIFALSIIGKFMLNDWRYLKLK